MAGRRALTEQQFLPPANPAVPASQAAMGTAAAGINRGNMNPSAGSRLNAVALGLCEASISSIRKGGRGRGGGFSAAIDHHELRFVLADALGVTDTPEYAPDPRSFLYGGAGGGAMLHGTSVGNPSAGLADSIGLTTRNQAAVESVESAPGKTLPMLAPQPCAWRQLRRRRRTSFAVRHLPANSELVLKSAPLRYCYPEPALDVVEREVVPLGDSRRLIAAMHSPAMLQLMAVPPGGFKQHQPDEHGIFAAPSHAAGSGSLVTAASLPPRAQSVPPGVNSAGGGSTVHHATLSAASSSTSAMFPGDVHRPLSVLQSAQLQGTTLQQQIQHPQQQMQLQMQMRASQLGTSATSGPAALAFPVAMHPHAPTGMQTQAPPSHFLPVAVPEQPQAAVTPSLGGTYSGTANSNILHQPTIPFAVLGGGAAHPHLPGDAPNQLFGSETPVVGAEVPKGIDDRDFRTSSATPDLSAASASPSLLGQSDAGEAEDLLVHIEAALRALGDRGSAKDITAWITTNVPLESFKNLGHRVSSLLGSKKNRHRFAKEGDTGPATWVLINSTE